MGLCLTIWKVEHLQAVGVGGVPGLNLCIEILHLACMIMQGEAVSLASQHTPLSLEVVGTQPEQFLKYHSKKHCSLRAFPACTAALIRAWLRQAFMQPQ